MTQCPNCGAGLRPGAPRCVKCGSIAADPVAPAGAPSAAGAQPQVVYVAPRAEPRNPAVAAVLSLVVPGLGQLYNGQLAKGIVFFVVACPLWFLCIGFLVHVVAAVEAYNTARKAAGEVQP